MSVRPWMKFYPSDWRGSTSLKLVSMGARGLWIEMLCIMHEAEPYGHLVHRGRAIEPNQLAAMVGCGVEEVVGWLLELEQNGVLTRKRSGVVTSPRMEKDEKRRRIGRETGVFGGNPSLSKHGEKSETVNGKPNGHPNPSRARVLEARGQRLESEKKEASASSRPRGCRLAVDWSPSEVDLAYALKLGFSADSTQRIAEKFRNYWHAKSGSGATKLDWAATWRNWILDESERQNRKPANRVGFV